MQTYDQGHSYTHIYLALPVFLRSVTCVSGPSCRVDAAVAAAAAAASSSARSCWARATRADRPKSAIFGEDEAGSVPAGSLDGVDGMDVLVTVLENLWTVVDSLQSVD